METEPNMVLRIAPEWRSYEDYLAALDAKYRRNAREQSKKLAAAGCTIEPLTDLQPQRSPVAPINLSVRQCVDSPGDIAGNYLPPWARITNSNFRCSVIRRDNTLSVSSPSIVMATPALGYYIGFDRAAAAEGLPIYLRLLHATVATAIDWRCKRLSLGRTALEPKAALGRNLKTCRYAATPVPALNWVLRGFAR